MKFPLRIIVFLSLSASSAIAQFSAEPHVLNTAGGKTTTSRFEFAHSVDMLGSVSASSTITLRSGFPGQLEMAPPTSSISISRAATGGILLRIQGVANQSYQLQTTASLFHPSAWLNVGGPKIAPANGVIEHQELAPSSPRFYRAAAPSP